MSGLPDGTRMIVTGNPTPEEVAAVVVALDATAAADAAPRGARRPAWQYAGRLEAIGGRIVRTPADLTLP